VYELIGNGPPTIWKITQTDKPGLKARTLCVVDGFTAEITHEVDIKHQDYNRHIIQIFDPRTMMWYPILEWGFDEVGRVPVFPESDTTEYLTGWSRTMWDHANAIVTLSRKRQEDIDVEQYTAERLKFNAELIALHETHAYGDNDEYDGSAVSSGLLTQGPEALNRLRQALRGDDEPPYTGTEPEDQG
jgi:hypothetical protein